MAGRSVQFLNRDIDDWTITFVETGATSNIGERLKAVEPYLKGEEMFLANYGDGLSDVLVANNAGYVSAEQRRCLSAAGAADRKFRYSAHRIRTESCATICPMTAATSGSTADSS